MGIAMNRHMIWAEDENFTGWCCSRCPWGVVAPRLEHRRRARLQPRGAGGLLPARLRTEHARRGDTLMQIPLATFSLRSGELLSPHSRGMSLHLADKTSANTTSPA